MPYYIATVYVLTAAADVVDGDAGLRHGVTRLWAKNTRDFEATIRDRYITDVDNQVWLGPISLSKDQARSDIRTYNQIAQGKVPD